jgi:glycine dehydrogenase subunit 1
MAIQNLQKAHYAKEQLKATGLDIAFEGPSFNEFVVKLNGSVALVNKKLIQKGIIGGYDLARDYPALTNHMLVAVTEMRTKEEIDRFVMELGDFHE